MAHELICNRNEVRPTTAVIPRVPTEAESYGYCRGQAVDLGPVMPAAQFRVTEQKVDYNSSGRDYPSKLTTEYLFFILAFSYSYQSNRSQSHGLVIGL